MTRLDTTWDGVPISKEPPFGASVVVYRRNSDRVEFLVLHRAHKGKAYAGEWAWTPPAGARRPNEPISDCAQRELMEETGLALVLEATNHGSEAWAVYCAEAAPAAVIRLDREHDRYEWQPLERAAAMCLPEAVSDYMLAIGKELRNSHLV